MRDRAGLASPSATSPPSPLQRADRGHHGGGAAGEHLGDLAAGDAVAPLVDGEPALLDLVAELAGQLDDRARVMPSRMVPELGGDDACRRRSTK